MNRRKWLAAISVSALSVLMPLSVCAECYCDAEEPFDVIVQNWQTFKPKVTAMHSLNSYLATDMGQQVYYIPTLEELGNVRSQMFDCLDYTGTRKKFAAIYDGYFNTECYYALVRKADGTYTKTPDIIKNEGLGSVRELTTLGYDFLLTSEGIQDIQASGSHISATYVASKLNLDRDSVDLGTAIMDIYKAIGQSKLDTTFAFTEDESMTLETSPIQKEIHLQLAQDSGIDVKDGAGWVFATRTNPSLYWVQAVRDGVLYDSESVSLGNQSIEGTARGQTASKTQSLTLAEFCSYAYYIMDIYGEPTMTSSEKGILLQLYGTSVPYKSVDEYAISAVENFIAKGIISPDDDADYLKWNAPINPRYFLTLLMRIADKDSRMTYKDVQVTLDAGLIEKNYYAANVSIESSSILDMEVDEMAAYSATYIYYSISEDEIRRNFGSDYGRESGLYTTTHLVVEGSDGKYYPLNTMVTTTNNPGLVTNIRDGTIPTTAFGVCDGWFGNQLQIAVVVFPVPDLIVNGVYKIRAIDSLGNCVGSSIDLTPGSPSSRDGSGGRQVNKYEKSWDYDDGEDEDEDEDDDDWMSEFEVGLSTTTSTVVTLTISEDSESRIMLQPNQEGAQKISLAEVLLHEEQDDGSYLLNEDDETDMRVRQISDTVYQISGASSMSDLQSRISDETGSAQTYLGFCQKDEELLVSATWLQEAGFISAAPVVDGSKMKIMTAYNEIYLDRERKLVLSGNTIYRLADKAESEIWFQSNTSDYFLNFRAVFGWTGDYLIFKDSGTGVITVNIKAMPNAGNNSLSGSDASNHAITIEMYDVEDVAVINGERVPNMGSLFSTNNLGQTIQGSIDRERRNTNLGKYKIPMSVTYPLANWFIYTSPNLFGTEGTDDDWLFVFKPKNVYVDGEQVVYDDSEARQQLEAVLGKMEFSDDNITVWAYRLYKGDDPERLEGNPKGFDFSGDYGWSYAPEKVTDDTEFFKSYFNKDSLDHVLPLVVDSRNKVRCVNYNSYSYNDNNEVKYLDYGCMPVCDVPRSERLMDRLSAYPMPRFIIRVREACNVVEEIDQSIPDLDSCQMHPTMVSPALWCMGLNEVPFEDIANNATTAIILRGTSRLTTDHDDEGNLRVWQGSTQLSQEDIEKMKFLLIRSSTASGRTEHIYSESQLSAFTLTAQEEREEENKEIPRPGTGIAGVSIDVIDWEEFTLERILEDFEFVVAIALVLVLFLIPRVCLFSFLMLLALAVIQNVKLVQWFCDRLFDPYKFLTFGRRDVHTFRQGVAFRNSIIAMAMFTLFMDGTIIHVYEWIMKFIGYILVGI